MFLLLSEMASRKAPPELAASTVATTDSDNCNSYSLGEGEIGNVHQNSFLHGQDSFQFLQVRLGLILMRTILMQLGYKFNT